jgi:hypothetical protein
VSITWTTAAVFLPSTFREKLLTPQTAHAVAISRKRAAILSKML